MAALRRFAAAVGRVMRFLDLERDTRLEGARGIFTC